MKKMSKKILCLTVAALLLTAGLHVDKVMAYFTAFDTANGGVEVDLGFTKTIPEENVVDGKKEIVLTNTGDYACYVRLKALTGDKYKDSLVYSGDSSWTPGADGYYYYSEIVEPKGTTTQINVSFTFSEEEPADFNVIIIQECTPVLYDDMGKPYADWDAQADVSQSIYQ